MSVSPTPHPEYIRASFQQQPLSLPSPPPRAPLLWGVKVWHQGQLGGEEAHSTSSAFCLTHHFPLCPGSPCQPWGHPSWVSGPRAAAGLCGLLTPLPAGMSEDWVQSPAWLLPACVMLHRLSLSCLKTPLMCRQRIYDKVCVARGTITHGDAQLLLLTELRPGRVVFTTPSKGLPLGYVPTWSHLDLQTPLSTAPDTAYGMA